MKLVDKDDNTIPIKTAMTDNGKSGSYDANSKFRNSRYVILRFNIYPLLLLACVLFLENLSQPLLSCYSVLSHPGSEYLLNRDINTVPVVLNILNM